MSNCFATLDAEILELEKRAGSEDDDLLALKAQFDDRILKLRIVGPAMGSGHFLIGACQYLAEQIATHPFTADDALADSSSEESSLSFWKRKVVEHCLFGVDINPLAVELAKLALWLETVALDQPLTFLDHHLLCGNSLIGATLKRIGDLPGQSDDVGLFSRQVEENLSALLEPLKQIESLSSDSIPNVRKKQQLYRTFERTREPFRQVADLWCAAFDEETEVYLTGERYQQAVNVIAKPRLSQKLAKEQWYADALTVARQDDVMTFIGNLSSQKFSSIQAVDFPMPGLTPSLVTHRTTCSQS